MKGKAKSNSPTKTCLEWITNICSTLSVIGIAILIHSRHSKNGETLTTQHNVFNNFNNIDNLHNNVNNNNKHHDSNIDIDHVDNTNVSNIINNDNTNDYNNDYFGSSSSSIPTPGAGMLNGATILVTGAGSGIGMATAHAVLRECGNVILLGRNSTKINNVYKNLTNNYINTLTYCSSNDNNKPKILKLIADIRNITQLRSEFSKIIKHFDKLDGCANIAGISGPIDYIDSIKMDDWLYSRNDPIYNNLYGTIESIRAEIEFMKYTSKQSYGVIVNAASQNSFEGCPQCALYVSSKFGIAGVTKSVALSYAKGNIYNNNLTLRVNAIAPGMIDTPLTRNQARMYQGLQPFECFDPLNNSKILSYGCPDIGENDPLYQRFKQELLDSGTIPIDRIIAPQEMANIIVFLLSNYSSAVTGDVWLADGGGTAM